MLFKPASRLRERQVEDAFALEGPPAGGTGARAWSCRCPARPGRGGAPLRMSPPPSTASKPSVPVAALSGPMSSGPASSGLTSVVMKAPCFKPKDTRLYKLRCPNHNHPDSNGDVRVF